MVTRVMILAGGTGGHVFPALAVAETLRDKGARVFWMGTKKGLESRVVPNAGISIDWLKVTGLRGKGVTQRIAAPFMLTCACIQAAGILIRRKPAVVLGMGGFVSGPGGLMSVLMRIPLVIHEQNRVPGTTNRLLARFSRVVLEAFPDSFDKKFSASCIGNPLRNSIIQHRITPRGVRTKVNVLVIGGSQGARALNEVVPFAIAKLTQAVDVIHQCGNNDLSQTQRSYEALAIKAEVKAFIDDMATMYRWADIVVCRAGAMTISELAACGNASILVPFPHAIDDHQTRNAEYLSAAGAAIILPQHELNADSLSSELTRLIGNRSILKTMADAAKKLAKPEAAEEVADICIALSN